MAYATQVSPRSEGGSGANRIVGDPVALGPFGRGPACRRAGVLDDGSPECAGHDFNGGTR